MLKLNLSIEAETKEKFLELFEEVYKQAQFGDDFLNAGDTKNFANGDIIDTDEQKTYWQEQAGYDLSENQIKFCIDAEEQGQEINFDYSGRGMFGKKCPSVVVSDLSDMTTKARTRTDSMGLDVVIYAQN